MNNLLDRKEAIKELYSSILNREADSSGLNHYLNSNYSIEYIQNILLNSEEYKIVGAIKIHENSLLVDRPKLKNLKRFHDICKIYETHNMCFIEYHDLIKFYYSNKSILDIEKLILLNENCTKYKHIRTKIKFLFKNKIDNDVSIISNNCLGNYFYRIILDSKPLSPTVNNVIHTDNFLKYINNLVYYTSIDAIPNLELSNKYGCATITLDDIEIQFPHSSISMSVDEANNWNKRSKRINFDNILILYRERDNDVTVDSINSLKQLNYKKILLFKKYTDDDSFIFNIQKNPFDLKDWYCEFNKIKNLKI
jgi:uncharacterized protein (DUF1919 family)